MCCSCCYSAVVAWTNNKYLVSEGQMWQLWLSGHDQKDLFAVEHIKGPFALDHPAAGASEKLLTDRKDRWQEELDFDRGVWGGGQFRWSRSLTCARLDANRVDRGSKLQTGHQLMGFVRLFGLALMVAAVDATTSRVTPQVRPPWSRGTITCDGATSTSHSTCLRYNYNNMMTEVALLGSTSKLQHESRTSEHIKNIHGP